MTPRGPHIHRKLWRFEQADDRDRERLDIVRRNEKSGDVVDNRLRRAVHGSRDDRACAGHGFEDGERHPFHERRQDDDVRSLEHLNDLFPPSEKMHAFADAQVAGELLEVRAVSAAHRLAAQGEKCAALDHRGDPHGGVKEGRVTLDLAEVPDNQHHMRCAMAPALAGSHSRIRSGDERRGVHGIRNGDDAAVQAETTEQLLDVPRLALVAWDNRLRPVPKAPFELATAYWELHMTDARDPRQAGGKTSRAVARRIDGMHDLGASAEQPRHETRSTAVERRPSRQVTIRHDVRGHVCVSGPLVERPVSRRHKKR